LNDLDFLRTLPDAAWTDGIAEAFKVAIIKDEKFFSRLCEIAPRLRARDEAAMEELVVRCAELHLQHIRENGDPFEFGQARPLDFGHWSAHKLEQMSGYAISHGTAVATGIALDSFYALEKGWITGAGFDAIHDGLHRAGFPLWHDVLEHRAKDGSLEVLTGLRDFQEHLGGELCVTMPRGLGAKFEIHEMDAAIIESAVVELKRRAQAAASGMGI
jgi:3-dehydroquinate synthase